MSKLHVDKDELKMRPKGWGCFGTYRQMPEEIHPKEIQNFMTAKRGGIGITMPTNPVTADWIDPSRESVDYPVLNTNYLSSSSKR